MDPQLTWIQPGGGVIVHLELAWGRLRRWYLKTFRKGYVARMRVGDPDDPLLRQVYLRHVRYRSFYPAKGQVHGLPVTTPRGCQAARWPAWAAWWPASRRAVLEEENPNGCGSRGVT